MDSITCRVVSRFISAANIPIGQSFFSGVLKVHRYREVIEVTDMTNAGKRGKRVSQLSVSTNESNKQDLLDTITDQLSKFDTYGEAKRYVDGLGQTGIYVNETVLRGVDVEPVGTEITLKAKGGLTISASPWEFHVKTHEPMTHPKTGEPLGSWQDTLFWPVKKQDGIVFYAWLKSNLSRAAQMTIQDLMGTWDDLGVRWDSH